MLKITDRRWVPFGERTVKNGYPPMEESIPAVMRNKTESICYRGGRSILSKTLWFGILCVVIGTLYGAIDFPNKFVDMIGAIFTSAVVVIAYLLLFPEQIKKKEREE